MRRSRVKSWKAGVSAALLAAATAFPAYALSEGEKALDSVLPSPSNLERLKRSLDKDSTNLDQLYSYGTMAKMLHQPEDAAWAFSSMLEIDPSLDRVKLDLASVYVEMGRFDEARALFMEVLAKNPPPQVQKNIQTVLAALEKQTRRHHFTGSFSFGYNWDTNANSAPSSGNVTVVDTTIPLGSGAGEKTDAHVFASLMLAHTYNGTGGPGGTPWQWKTSFLSYGTEQNALDNLNLKLYSVNTGPEFVFPESQVKVTGTLGYSHIILDGFSYLGNPKGAVKLERPLELGIIGYYGFSYEYRNFMNSPTNTTYRGRTGNAWQHQFGMKRPVSEKALVDFTVLMRREQAKELYFSNQQTALTLSYIRSLDEKTFLTSSLGYRLYEYDQPDFLISSQFREDNEYTASIMLGRKIDIPEYGEVIGTVGYQFRDMQANIQNYEYENHRFMAVLTRNF